MTTQNCKVAYMALDNSPSESPKYFSQFYENNAFSSVLKIYLKPTYTNTNDYIVVEVYGFSVENLDELFNSLNIEQELLYWYVREFEPVGQSIETIEPREIGNSPIYKYSFNWRVEASTSTHTMGFKYRWYTQNAVAGSEAMVEATAIVDSASVRNSTYPVYNTDTASCFWIRDVSFTFIAPVNTCVQRYRLYGTPEKSISLTDFAKGSISVAIGKISDSLNTVLDLSYTLFSSYSASQESDTSYDTLNGNNPPAQAQRKWNTVMDSSLFLMHVGRTFKAEIGIYDYLDTPATRSGTIYFDAQIYNNLSGDVVESSVPYSKSFTVKYS